MAKFDFDIGIIGGGAAGLTVTAGAAQLGARTLLLEREEHLGGDCLHYGCVPSKTLIRTAQIYHAIRRAPEFGLPKVEVPRVNFRDVAARIQQVIAAVQQHDSRERFCQLGARVEIGRARFTDEHTVQVDGKKYTAKTWVIATGSSPARPPIDGLQSTPFITNREIFSLEQLPESLLIVGGGPIAIEMAQAFSRLGSTVTVVQRSGQILTREDRDLADEVMQILGQEGVRFYLDSTVLGVRNAGNRRQLTIRDNRNEEVELYGDTILVATGRQANVAGLDLKGLGIEFTHQGITVDRRLRTTHKHIYAAGDVTGRYQFTHAAGYEGGIVVSNAIFRLPRKVNYTLLPWCTYTDPELASMGMNEKAAAAAGVKYSLWVEEFRNNDRSLAEGETRGKIKLVLDEKEKPIGVQILGPQAGELLSEWVAALHGKVKLATLAAAMHPYPTLAEINKKVAAAFFSTKIFSDRVKKGLQFFFSLKGRACGDTVACEK
ncbi:MAG: FAD-dependent oxidoreductase [Deltaproteobacteria bacterium]|nr:FAD-dependent oxidoreductase [Deltaproteobacteria bacterium]MBW2069814.1 FAD-dependent oxidoreductase [Deltaproteobacteria bacterium]